MRGNRLPRPPAANRKKERESPRAVPAEVQRNKVRGLTSGLRVVPEEGRPGNHLDRARPSPVVPHHRMRDERAAAKRPVETVVTAVAPSAEAVRSVGRSEAAASRCHQAGEDRAGLPGADRRLNLSVAANRHAGLGGPAATDSSNG